MAAVSVKTIPKYFRHPVLVLTVETPTGRAFFPSLTIGRVMKALLEETSTPPDPIVSLSLLFPVG